MIHTLMTLFTKRHGHFSEPDPAARARVAGVASRAISACRFRVLLPSHLCDCATQFYISPREAAGVRLSCLRSHD